MDLKRYFVLAALTIINISLLFGQQRRSPLMIGVSAGAMNYQGDIAGDIESVKFTRAGFGVNARYRVNSFIVGKIGFVQGYLEARDDRSPRPSIANRKLSFRSPITEISALVIFDFLPTPRSFYYRPDIVPYAFSGIGIFSFNPRSQVNGNWYELQPLGTEGQFLPDPNNEYPEPYKLTQFTIPGGMGLKIKVARFFDVEAEVGFRLTFTDYLDDISTVYPDMEELRAQNPVAALLSMRGSPDDFPNGLGKGSVRGNPAGRDWYFYSNIGVVYYIDKVRCPRF